MYNYSDTADHVVIRQAWSGKWFLLVLDMKTASVFWEQLEMQVVMKQHSRQTFYNAHHHKAHNVLTVKLST